MKKAAAWPWLPTGVACGWRRYILLATGHWCEQLGRNFSQVKHTSFFRSKDHVWFWQAQKLLVPFSARFSSDVNLWENQVVVLFCIKWDSSQSFPRVTLGLNLLHHLHGNQRPASECGCLLNPLLASLPSSAFSVIKNDLPPFALTHSRSHTPTIILCPHFFVAVTSFQSDFKVLYPIKKMNR